MKILLYAILGLTIFVSQPGTIIIVGDLSPVEALNGSHAVSSALLARGDADFSVDRLVVLADPLRGGMRSDLVKLQSVGPKRGPVK